MFGLKSPASWKVGPSEPSASGSRGQTVLADPLQHSAWDSALAAHPTNSFFHQSAWAWVLHETYGHRPCYLCRFADGGVVELLPLMEVNSLWTGRHAVSLPFTDLCPVLQTQGSSPGPLYDQAVHLGRERRWRYLECRSGTCSWPGATPSLAFFGHVIDLGRQPEALFQECEASTRRAIRKAEAAGLRVEFSTGIDSMRTFYRLHCRTRRRHRLPPQPFRFFECITRRVLGQGLGFVAIARLGERPVAADVFFHSGRQALYKFGASDYAFQGLRPNNLLMWEAIKRFAGSGFSTLHLGRTSLANEGLRRFKLGFNACEERIEYYKYDLRRQAFVTQTDNTTGWHNHLFSHLPLPFLRLAGSILYPHLS